VHESGTASRFESGPCTRTYTTKDTNMATVTAKVICTGKEPAEAAGDDAHTTLSFGADYADERNKDWAWATPALSLSMTVRGDVAAQFTQGQRFTLEFQPEQNPEP
jgi:hypothetical protein